MKHVEVLSGGVAAWNKWREEHQDILPDLSGANLSKTDLEGANLGKANLARANLLEAQMSKALLSHADLSRAYLGKADMADAQMDKANLREANLKGANLNGVNLEGADLRQANLQESKLNKAALNGTDLKRANLMKADLSGAYLIRTDFTEAILKNATLCGAVLEGALLVETDLTDADISRSRIYGISTWDLKLEGTKQGALVITEPNTPQITIDNLELAQFIYLLLCNKKIRSVIDTVISKVVLILGRFTAERKVILDGLRDELRNRNLLPVIFDFSIPGSRNVTETVKVLAGLSRFVIADITDATEVRAELHNIIKDFPSLPVQPVLLRGQPEFVSLKHHLNKYPWVLSTFEYDSQEHLLVSLERSVVGPAEARVLELRGS